MTNDRSAQSSSSPAIVIACGGDGSRMGGRKPFRLLGDKFLIDHVIEWALRHSDCIALGARDRTQLPSREYPAIMDKHQGIGPISGLARAFEFSELNGREFVVLVACDQPFLPNDLIPRLSASVGHHIAAIPCCNGRKHPFAALWRVEPRMLANFLKSGGRSLQRFADQAGASIVQWPAPKYIDPFFNVNDQAALKEAETSLKIAMQ